jgi:hypothetical protein
MKTFQLRLRDRATWPVYILLSFPIWQTQCWWRPRHEAPNYTLFSGVLSLALYTPLFSSMLFPQCVRPHLTRTSTHTEWQHHTCHVHIFKLNRREGNNTLWAPTWPHLPLTSSWKQFSFIAVLLRYLNFSAFPTDLSVRFLSYGTAMSVHTRLGIRMRRVNFYIKGKVVTLRSMKGGIAPRILNLDTKWQWVTGFEAPTLYPCREQRPVATE